MICRAWLGALALLLLSPALPPLQARQEARSEPSDALERGSLVAVYRVTGVIDSQTAATAFHCTNIGGTTFSLQIDIFEFNGLLECTVSDNMVPSNQTSTLLTRAALVFADDGKCNPVPFIQQGHAVISVSSAGVGNVVCTAQVLDPSSATPAFVSNLDLFRP